MIRFISTEQTIPLRSSVLREGLPIKACYFDGDNDSTTFHLGYFHNSVAVCILTCIKDSHGKLPKNAYRLRGMATHPAHRRKGYAAALLAACVIHLKDHLGIEYLWFNAQKRAFPFYEALGFAFMSDEFDIPTAGPHREMFKYL